MFRTGILLRMYILVFVPCCFLFYIVQRWFRNVKVFEKTVEFFHDVLQRFIKLQVQNYSTVPSKEYQLNLTCVLFVPDRADYTGGNIKWILRLHGKKFNPGWISARVEIFIPVYVTRDEIFSPVKRDEISHAIANKFKQSFKWLCFAF